MKVVSRAFPIRDDRVTRARARVRNPRRVSEPRGEEFIRSSRRGSGDDRAPSGGARARIVDRPAVARLRVRSEIRRRATRARGRMMTRDSKSKTRRLTAGTARDRFDGGTQCKVCIWVCIWVLYASHNGTTRRARLTIDDYRRRRRRAISTSRRAHPSSPNSLVNRS